MVVVWLGGAHCLLVDTDEFFNNDDRDDDDCFYCLDFNAYVLSSNGHYDDDDFYSQIQKDYRYICGNGDHLE